MRVAEAASKIAYPEWTEYRKKNGLDRFLDLINRQVVLSKPWRHPEADVSLP